MVVQDTEDGDVEKQMSRQSPLDPASESSESSDNNGTSTGTIKESNGKVEPRMQRSTSSSTSRRRSVVGLRHALKNVAGNQSSGSKELGMMRRCSAHCLDPSVVDSPNPRVERQEGEVRRKAQKSRGLVGSLNIMGALKVFLFYLISPESLATCAVSIGLTYFWYEKLVDDSTNTKNGSIDRVLLTFAIITPISVSIGMAFTRRERALTEIVKFRSFAYSIYMAHATWDWGQKCSGRATCDVDWLAHSDDVMSLLVSIADDLSRFLTLPTASRGRHRFTASGRKEATRTLETSYRLFDSLSTQRMTRLTMLVEKLKRNGLSQTECSRIRQYERYVSESCEQLRFLKSYRTPEALRAFARLFVLFLPPFYASSFAQIAYNLNSLGLGIAFAVITSLALAALFESVEVLEDPFVGHTALDGIDTIEELQVLHWQQLVNAREVVFPYAQDFPVRCEPAMTSSLGHVRGPIDMDAFLSKDL